KSRVEAVVAFADRRAGKTPIKPTGGLGFSREGSRVDFAQRLGMELWIRTGDTYRRATIVTGREGSEHALKYYAIIPPESTEAEFIVRLTNRGLPTQRDYDMVFGMRHPDITKERNRLFGVVLTVDGVNSFFQDLGDGEPKPAIVPPSHASKWVLGPPGQEIVPADNPHGYALRTAREGTGHSVINVRGFQKDDKKALAFKFAPASQSVAAEKIGIVSEIGEITAHFYPEKLPGDEQRLGAVMSKPRLGTAT